MRLTQMLIAAAAMLAIGTSVSNAQQKSTWETIQENKMVRVGCVNGEPFAYKDPASGEWKGIVPAFAALIAKEMEVDWECVETTWGTAVAGLQANQFDFVGGLDATPQRAMAIDFAPGTLVYYAMAILARKDLPVENWSDLNKPEITAGVPLGTSSDRILTDLLDKAQFNRAKGNPEAVAAFASNRTDFIAGSSVWLTMQNHALGDQGKVVVPKPALISTADVGIRREEDKRWRDWLGVSLSYFYWKGSIKQAYEEFLEFRGINAKSAPGIRLQELQ
ncbi:MAG: transporter substrate-binding domain-containing protein [Rhizobiaceae bacterium]